jgi:hypothetical protein
MTTIANTDNNSNRLWTLSSVATLVYRIIELGRKYLLVGFMNPI